MAAELMARETRLVCDGCGAIYVSYSSNPRKLCRFCGAGLVDAPVQQNGEHLEAVYLSDREKAWSARLLASVYPEGVTL